MRSMRASHSEVGSHNNQVGAVAKACKRIPRQPSSGTLVNCSTVESRGPPHDISLDSVK